MRKATKIVHLTSAHPPFDTRIFHRECVTLAQQSGNEVVLVVPQGSDEERINGVRVHAVPKPKGRLRRMTLGPFSVLRAALSEKADIYHFHDPELIPIGILLKLLGRTVIADIHEDVPADILGKDWISPRYRRLLAGVTHVIEQLGARCFDRIIAATPHIARKFPSHKTRTVQNFPRIAELDCGAPKPYSERKPIVFYVGDITVIRGIREMVQAVGLLPSAMDVRLVLAGKFSPETLRAEIEGLSGWDRVEFVGWQSRAEVASLLSEVRVGLVLFHPAPNHLDAQPNKLFEYMAAGIPVVASDFPRWRELVGVANSGLLVDPLDPKAISEAILWLLTHPEEACAMGQRGAEAIQRQFNWDTEARVLLETYRELMS